MKEKATGVVRGKYYKLMVVLAAITVIGALLMGVFLLWNFTHPDRDIYEILIGASLFVISAFAGHKIIKYIEKQKELGRKAFSVDSTIFEESWFFSWAVVAVCAANLLLIWGLVVGSFIFVPETMFAKVHAGNIVNVFVPAGLLIAFFSIPGLLFAERLESMLNIKIREKKKAERAASQQQEQVLETPDEKIPDDIPRFSKKATLAHIKEIMVKKKPPKEEVEEYGIASMPRRFFRWHMMLIMAYLVILVFKNIVLR